MKCVEVFGKWLLVSDIVVICLIGCMVLGNELAKSKWFKSVKNEISDLTVAEECLTVDVV